MLLFLAAILLLSPACSVKRQFQKAERLYSNKKTERAAKIFTHLQQHPTYDLGAQYYLLRIATKRARNLREWARADSAFAALARRYEGIGAEKAAKLRQVKAGQGNVRMRRVSFQRRAIAFAERENRVTLLDSVAQWFPDWLPKLRPSWDTARAHVVNRHLKTTDYDIATSILNRHKDVVYEAHYGRVWKLRDGVWNFFEKKYPLCQMSRFRSDHPWHDYSRDCWFKEANRAFCAESLDSVLAFHLRQPYTALEYEAMKYLAARNGTPEAAELSFASRRHLADVSTYFKTLQVLFECSQTADTAALRRDVRDYTRRYAPRLSAFALLIVATQYYARQNQPEQVRQLLTEMRPLFPDSSVCKPDYDFQVDKRARIDTCSACLGTSPEPLNYRIVEAFHTDRAEYSAVSWDEGDEAYFAQKNKRKRLEVVRSVRDERGQWSVPQPVHTLSLGGKAVPMSITADGRQLLLKAGKRLYIAQRPREDAPWNAPQRLPLKVPGLERAVFAPDGKAILVSACYNEPSLAHKQTTDLYVCLLNKDGAFEPPRSLGLSINTKGNETNPYLCEDGKTLLFCSDEHPGYGNLDVFVARRIGPTWMTWTVPQNLGCQINAIGDDYGFTWVPSTGRRAFFTKIGACSKDLDIGQMDLPLLARPKQLAQLRGQLLNSKGRPVTRGQVSIALNGGDQVVRVAVSPTGRYRYKLPDQVLQATVYPDVLGYFTARDTLHDLRSAPPGVTLRDTFVLLSMAEMRKPFRLKYATFDDGKATLNDPRVYRQLGLLRRFAARMKATMSIAAHTDQPGSVALSLQRAMSVQVALMERFGTPAQQLSVAGRGAADPLCPDDRSPAGRLCNQRVEVQFDIPEEMQKTASRGSSAATDGPTVEELPVYQKDTKGARKRDQRTEAEQSAQPKPKVRLGQRIKTWVKKVFSKPKKKGEREEGEEGEDTD